EAGGHVLCRAVVAFHLSRHGKRPGICLIDGGSLCGRLPLPVAFNDAPRKTELTTFADGNSRPVSQKEQTMARISSLAGRLILTVVLCGFAPHVAAQSQYSVTDLGILPTFTASFGDGINASGQVAGSSARTGVEHGSVWTSGTLQDVGTLSGFGSSAAVG